MHGVNRAVNGGRYSEIEIHLRGRSLFIFIIDGDCLCFLVHARTFYRDSRLQGP